MRLTMEKPMYKKVTQLGIPKKITLHDLMMIGFLKVNNSKLTIRHS